MDCAAPPPPVKISLRQLFPQAQWVHGEDVVAGHITDRAQDVAPGSVFVAREGVHCHGREFLRLALERGATGLILEQAHPELSVTQCLVANPRAAYSIALAALAGNPQQEMDVFGVTGTNGKSTTAWMFRSILEAAGRPCGLLGTIEYSDGLHISPAQLTTPDPATLWTWLRRTREGGTTALAIELSSHALHQQRTAGLSLAVAAVTNITQDHLDYHATMDAYRAAKSQIFAAVRPGGVALLNADDPLSRDMADGIDPGIPLLRTGIENQADIMAADMQHDVQGTRFQLCSPWGTVSCRIPLPGPHNVSNALFATAAALSVGCSLETVTSGLEKLRPIPGRLQRLPVDQPYSIFVDYAHTPDALERVLRTLRPLTRGRLICVFGAGGDRDPGKRPLLGAAARMADLAIVTSDNPRSENPARIAEQIFQGLKSTQGDHFVELDRELAIGRAIELAEPGDTVLIAGKGHEQEQIVGSLRIPFDDTAVATRLVERRVFSFSHRRSA